MLTIIGWDSYANDLGNLLRSGRRVAAGEGELQPQQVNFPVAIDIDLWSTLIDTLYPYLLEK